MTLPTTTPIQTRLTDAASSRLHQLEGLPTAEDDPVVAAQRTALTQTLEDIAAAQGRVNDGTYGRCVGCQGPISHERLEFRPWAESCITCAAR
jgi:DnaK suppressor protein